MKPYGILILPLLWCNVLLFAQSAGTRPAAPAPRLVVGLVVDQMRWDYLHRFSHHFGSGGFRRLLREGFECENTYIDHIPTYTGVGHATVYTGAYPSVHGIVGNQWYDRARGRMVYCSEDTTARGVGSDNESGRMGPRQMLASTITDELRLASGFRSRVVGISLKDRGAILPAGHTANAAYWYDDKTGRWISSTRYMERLPLWVTLFNDRREPDRYLSTDWEPLHPLSQYVNADDTAFAFESLIPGDSFPYFPHRTRQMVQKKYSAFRFTPFSSTYTLDFARSAIEQEGLGRGPSPDFLAVSLSGPDYTGHAFGPQSAEVEDVYARLDRDLEQFLRFLDRQVGQGQYIFFLTADHGVGHNPLFLQKQGIPAGLVDDEAWMRMLNDSLASLLGLPGLVQKIENAQVYLDMPRIAGNENEVYELIRRTLLREEAVMDVFPLADVNQVTLPRHLAWLAANSFHAKRSGDLQIIYNPGYLEGKGKGTTHGLWNPYDSHIPLLWFGWGIKAGTTRRRVLMNDIAATLAALLHVQVPNGCTGNPVGELFR